MLSDSSTSLAPGFRFHPTDEELVSYYLRRKISGKPFRFDPIAVVDIYKSEPWDLPCQSKLKSRDLEWYFFSALDKKYGNGSRTNRATEKGYWKTTGKDRPVKHNSKIVGMKKTLVYHNGRAPRGTRTNWVMHEYKHVEDEALFSQGISRDAFVLCRIFQKSGSGPKNGEQYGAPYVEEEWKGDINEDELPTGGAVGNELLVPDDSFFETNDLEQNLDTCITSECAPQSLNFYHGESSHHGEYDLGFTIDEKEVVAGNVDIVEPCNDLSGVIVQPYVVEAKPLSGNLESFEPCNDKSVGAIQTYPAVEAKSVAGYIEELRPYNDQSVGVTAPYVTETNPMTDNFNENPFSFKYSLDELYLDATDEPKADTSVVEGSFLETNDLANPIKIEDSAGADMMDGYFTSFGTDDDITQYIDFDAFESLEDPNPVESLPISEQVMHDHTELLGVARKQDMEAYIDFEEGSSSKKTAEKVKHGTGFNYPFLNQASQMLESIPAPPAFASEFPTKDAALQLHDAAQASGSVHFTAGMIRIGNITFSGSGIGLALRKNGDVDIVLSSHLCPDDTSAALPLSGLLAGKAAFMVSHGWIFLMFFWVLILSFSCKIGSLMYTG